MRLPTEAEWEIAAPKLDRGHCWEWTESAFGEITYTATDEFQEDVMRGLSAPRKFLQSKYFYDAKGDMLFQQIMDCPEYYLTRCEMEIFSTQLKALSQTFIKRDKAFDILGLGAGDAIKSTRLLRYLSQKEIDYTFFSINISENIICLFEKKITQANLISNL